jgi:hypothetical protein
MTRRILIALAPVALLLTGCDIEDMSSWGQSDKFKEDFHLNYPMKPGGTLSIDNFNGSIEISSWEKDEIDVNGIKYGGTEELMRQVKVEGSLDGNVLRLRTIRPEGRRGNCGAKYILRVPKKMLLDGIVSTNGSIRVENMLGNARLQSSNGSIKIRSLEGRLDAKTSNASIDVATMQGDFTGQTSNGSIKVDGLEGGFEASTSNSSITARVTKLPEGRPIKADSSNGSIDLSLPDYKGQALNVDTSNSSIVLRLPEKVGADVRASTSNSSITSEFEMSATGTISKTRMEGKIGGGGGPIRLTTSNGNIRLQKL